MKKYLFLAVAALGFAACAEKGLDNGPVQNGELEQSYVAITLAADDMTTKAGTDPVGVYDDGDPAERKVESAYVFFFKDDNAFPVTLNGNTSENSGLVNYLPVTLPDNGQDMNNVSDVKDAVLILKNYKGQYPNQIVAVLNWTPAEKLYKLSDLQQEITGLRGDNNGFIMDL